MGYEVHITRAPSWTESEARPISLAEWRAYVAADPEMELTGVAETHMRNGRLRYENPGLARWKGHPTRADVWFNPQPGRVVVKNPDEATIVKMISVARSLRARVEGDDGETYGEPDEPPSPPRRPLGSRLASWLRRWRRAPPIEPPRLAFGVGDRVRDIRGRQGTILAIDLKAEHGLGIIRARFDDGSELSYAATAHDLTVVPPAEKG